jgi:predicted enzyme related to lactoylglutathione lyase
MHGQFAWYDLMSPDIGASKKFYPPVTGWTTEMWKGDYAMWVGPKGPLGGIGPATPSGIQPHWLAYVNVNDVDAAASKVRSLGGKVLHGPEVIPDVGRFAIIADPQGAMLAIFKGDAGMEGHDGTYGHGKFTWHELMTSDYAGAFDFYRQLFGWQKIEEMDMGPAGKYLEYGLNGKMFGGIYNRSGREETMAPRWLFYVGVPDINKSVDAVKRGGGNVVMGPMEVPGGSMVAVAIDAQGAGFGLHQQAKAAAKPKAAKKAKPKKAAKKAKPRKAARKKPKTRSRPKKKAAKKARRRR